LKKIVSLLLCIILVFSLSACGEQHGNSIASGVYDTVVTSVDYETAEDFETALNNGEDMVGKTVTFVVAEVKPDSTLGFDLWAGKHLNFVSDDSVDVKKGDTISVRVLSVKTTLGDSWVIKYEMIDVQPSKETTSSTTTEPTKEIEEKKPDTSSSTTTNTTTTPAVNSSKPTTINGIPAYSGKAYVSINNNNPTFTASEKTTTSYEYYSNLDSLGRCGVAVACIGRDLMPTEERGSIGSVKPTGWQTVKYDNVDGKYLYNRCHLIGYQLSGENANTKNLITGTRYLNVTGMLPFENMVADYVKETGNHVMYRVTPIFDGKNLLASGVQMEGYSVEDKGDGICFNVYCYNVQPGITINYANGNSSLANGGSSNNSSIATSSNPTITTQPSSNQQAQSVSYILNTKSKKFHYSSCGSAKQISDSNKSTYSGSRDSLISQGYSPCGNCHP